MSFEIYKYRVWCNVDQQWEYVWLDEDEEEPTVCPSDPSHDIDQEQTSIVDTIGKDANLDQDGNQVMVLSGGDTSIGIQAVQVLNLPDDSDNLIKSYQIKAPPLTTEILDIFIGDDLVGPQGKCFLEGGEYRCRTPATEGSALTFEIVDRNDLLGYFIYYGMQRTKLINLTDFEGGTIDDLAVGELVFGESSGSRTEILATNEDSLDIKFHETGFQDGEMVTFLNPVGEPTGIRCRVGEWDEGDVISVNTSVKDEWIEGMDMRDVSPGGSKEIPEGMYFRVKCYNADPENDLRVKVSLSVGRL